MKTKKEIAIKLTEKNRKKVQGILEMFGEKIFSNKSIISGYYIEFIYGDWVGSTNMSNKHLIKPRELRNILAYEKLKAGDYVCVEDSGDVRVGRFVYFTDEFGFEVVDLLGETNFTEGCFENFKRYATQEEIDLLEGKGELTKDDYKDLTWYKCKGTKSLIFIDKSKTETVGILGNNNFEFIFNLEWFNLFKENGFHIKHEWQEATEQEVESSLIKEAKRIGFKYGVKVKPLIKSYEQSEYTLFGDSYNYYTDKNQLFAGGILVFDKGKWATIIEVDKFAELKEAHKNGAVIECLQIDDTWFEIENPKWTSDANYRIKPDDKPKVGDVVKLNSSQIARIKNEQEAYSWRFCIKLNQQEVIDLLFKD